jgi:tRNA pseudouridine55 synthase
VVAWARRVTGCRAIGHAGTLDPMATGLLVLLVGQATRLSSLLTGKDKTYDVEIRLGFSTTTDDADGEPIGPPSVALPSDTEIRVALEHVAAAAWQRPPAYSAKKVDGRVAYRRARNNEPVTLKDVPVSVRSIDWQERQGDRLRLRLTVSAGFYVRALARDLGARLGVGGHLSGLRRVSSGAFTLGGALTLTEAESLGPELGQRLIAPADAVADLPAFSVTEAGLTRIRHGNAVGLAAVSGPAGLPNDPGSDSPGRVRILGADGRLVALGQWRSGSLHPVVVLG